MTRRRVLLVEPYLGGSHQAWAEGVVAHCGHDVDVVSHPARWWTWRMRGAAVTLAEQCRSLAARPELVVATDMLDLAAFRTFARDAIGDAPVGLYLHESQLTYPDSPQMQPDLGYAFTNWLSVLAADVVWFNSAYHRDAFFGALPRFLRRFPDHTHDHLVEAVRSRARVLEVGVDLGWAGAPLPRSGPVRLMWNHRWEHDKDPDAFAAAVDVMAAEGHPFEIVLCGERFGTTPTALDALADRHPERIVHLGRAQRHDYVELLSTCDVVVSTARQEFFGISVVEAVAAGCMPVLPRRLSYPGLIPERYHDVCLYADGALVDRLRWVVTHADDVRDLGAELAPEMRRWDWASMGPRYRAEFERLASGAGVQGDEGR